MSFSPSKPFRAFIKENLQRYDIVDHNLVGDMVFNLSNEVNKDLLLADVIGRVFKGFTPSDGGSLNSVAVSEGVAVSADGQLFVLPSGGSSPSASIPSVSGSVYGVYATVVEQEAPSGEYENRRKWLPASGSPASETSVSVPVKKYKTVQLNVTDRLAWTSPAAIDISSLFPSVVDAGGIQIAAVAINSSGQKALIDCRKVFASSGNIVTDVTVGGTSISVTGLAAESHTFPSTGDTKTLGIFSVRGFLGALADRVKAITGKSNWWTSPAMSLEYGYTEIGSLWGEVTTIGNTTNTNSSKITQLENGYSEGAKALTNVARPTDLATTSPNYLLTGSNTASLYRSVAIVKDNRVSTSVGTETVAVYSFVRSSTDVVTAQVINQYIKIKCTNLPAGVTYGYWQLLTLPSGVQLDGSIISDALADQSVIESKLADSSKTARGRIKIIWTDPVSSQTDYSSYATMSVEHETLPGTLTKLTRVISGKTFVYGFKFEFSTTQSWLKFVNVSPYLTLNVIPTETEDQLKYISVRGCMVRPIDGSALTAGFEVVFTSSSDCLEQQALPGNLDTTGNPGVGWFFGHSGVGYVDFVCYGASSLP